MSGTDGVRIIIPMGDLVTPLELYERAEAATTQEELKAINEEVRAFESWAKAEFEQRRTTLALEARINPEDSVIANSGAIPKDWIPERGGTVGILPGQMTYLLPGVQRYPFLGIPKVPRGRNPGNPTKGGDSGVRSGRQSASHSNSHSSHHSEVHSHASGRSTTTPRRSGGRDPYGTRRSASGY
ncbi:MAG: hypothetical protein Q9196_005969 [Gyalolechia fulgens]